MYIISDAVTFTWPVTVKVPVNGGKFEEMKFTAKFEYVDDTEANKLSPTELSQRVLVGWEEISDSKGPVAYSVETKAGLLARPYFKSAVVTHFMDAILGQGALLKN